MPGKEFLTIQLLLPVAQNTPMRNHITWSPSAERDFSGILNYLFENWNEKTARSFIERTENLIHQISINPRQFPIINRKLKIRKSVLVTICLVKELWIKTYSLTKAKQS